jgi:hypothetical protein
MTGDGPLVWWGKGTVDLSKDREYRVGDVIQCAEEKVRKGIAISSEARKKKSKQKRCETRVSEALAAL